MSLKIRILDLRSSVQLDVAQAPIKEVFRRARIGRLALQPPVTETQSSLWRFENSEIKSNGALVKERLQDVHFGLQWQANATQRTFELQLHDSHVALFPECRKIMMAKSRQRGSLKLAYILSFSSRVGP